MAMISGSCPLYPEGLHPWVLGPKPWNTALKKGGTQDQRLRTLREVFDRLRFRTQGLRCKV